MPDTPSSSAGVTDTATGKSLPAGSMHLLIVALDPTDMVRAVGVMSSWLILGGYGFVRIDRNGTAHVQSPIDTVASGRSERIWYAGRPRLDNPPDEPDRLVLDDTLRRTVIQRGAAF